ncbi:cytidine deaminase [Thomasclavelia cocleata]|uniref:Cytidine deaminase n=1 Tax=Thomasclavelia cocleata TaxID=69824 RepID=A0A1I0DHD2_9FIRM|nr:cytidine deaminase [Thomasclavelia cocleata]MCR1961115.1 cytidine deaminase [Thomasclavelia cocleata]NDO42637.1 cytidine deaminase [Thomasclavelia cocleata]PJN80428.1 cytidine deaminase [Thomasclavelia cocleata]SET31477.1 cytidine deaminase [Thomasclavelia cocleata]
MDYQEIIKKAFDAAKNSYSPYSNFKVGACVEMNDGVYFLGTNIENAAYGSTMCAERNAVYGAYCNGYTKSDIKQLAIAADCNIVVSPCGACRQVLSELIPEKCPIILANHQKYIITSMKELLPMAFTEENL